MFHMIGFCNFFFLVTYREHKTTGKETRQYWFIGDSEVKPESLMRV